MARLIALTEGYLPPHGRVASVSTVLLLAVPWLLALSVATAHAQTPELYGAAIIGNDGALHIARQQGREAVIPEAPDTRFPEAEPAFFERPLLSNDRSAVGSRRFYHCCGNSSEIPLALVVYANG